MVAFPMRDVILAIRLVEDVERKCFRFIAERRTDNLRSRDHRIARENWGWHDTRLRVLGSLPQFAL